MDQVHRRPDGTSAFCGMDKFGRCRLCDLLDRDGPHYEEAYRRRYFPGEFPDAPPAPIVVAAAAPEPTAAPPIDPELARLAEACPHRKIPECGCRGMECVPGGRRPGARVSIADCVACVSADRAPSSESR